METKHPALKDCFNHIKVHALKLASVRAALWEDGCRAKCLLSHTEVRWLSKGRSLARVFELREPLQRFLSKKVSTGSTFQWQGVGRKTRLPVQYIQPAQWTQSVTSGENDNCLQVGRWSSCILSQTGIVGTVSEQRDIWHVLNISRDFGRDWAWAFILPAGARSPVFAFRRVQALLITHKRPMNCEGMDPRPICEQTRWIKHVRARRSTAGDWKWRWP